MNIRNLQFSIMFRPCAGNLNDNEKMIMNAKDSVTTGFVEAYTDHIGTLTIIAESAKVYIQKNWRKVNDWSDLNLSLMDNTRIETRYHNHKPETIGPAAGKTESLFHKIMNDAGEAMHNPVVTFTDVVLDPTDGDFSVTINGKDHLWIDDESVILIAGYMEEKLMTPRMRAIKWWNGLDPDDKFTTLSNNTAHVKCVGDPRDRIKSLTGSEIEKLWKSFDHKN